jgi:hypothetical protein
MSQAADIAVYAEHSDSQKTVEPGWNARVFNRTEMELGSSIRRAKETGVITLGPGVYHITGSSQVTYNDLAPHPRTGGWNTEARPSAGYCRLRHASTKPPALIGNEKVIVVGTISNANMLPSLIDAYLDVPHQAELVLEHQVGEDVAGIYLQDNAAHSPWHVFARIAIHRVSDTPATHERPAVNAALCAAFHEYLADPERYSQLYASYLGVAPKLVPECGDVPWPRPADPTLSRVLNSGVLRFGYAEGDPYVYHGGPDHDGELMGLDWELGNALAAIIREQYFHYAPGKGLRAEWVRVTVPPGGDPEVGRFNVLHAGLMDGLFDVAMSGQADLSGDQTSPAATREVSWTAPTALLFTNILYTGKGGEDMRDQVGGSRERFIDRVKGWPQVKIMCVKNPGPSPINSAALVSDINAAGGHAELSQTESLDAMKHAIASQEIHFSVGDAVASSWIGHQPGFAGLNLNIAAATQPLETAQPVAAFTLAS